MLDDLDDAAFANLEDAYGPATAVPGLLRAMAGERVRAERALGELAGGIFHQGSFFSATPLATRFLLELASHHVPARAAIIGLMAEMANGIAPPALAWNPYDFYSSPAPLDYPEATKTLDVVREGRPCFDAALGSDDVEVRAAAARLLSALPPSTSSATLATALERETDAGARCTMVLALARLGQCVSPRALTGLASDVAHACEVLSFGDVAVEHIAPLERLACEPRLSWRTMPFEAGDVSTFGILAIMRLAKTHHDTAVEALWRAFDARIARGERLAPHVGPPTDRVNDEAQRAPATSEPDDAGLRAIAGVLASIEVPEAPERAYLRREALDQRARRVLALTVTHGIPLRIRGAPWITPETMRRFLEGGGPLDRELTIGDRRASAFEHLHALPPANDPRRAPAARAIVDALSPDELFELIADVLSGAYPVPSSLPLTWIAVTELAPLARDGLVSRRERFAAYAESLVDKRSASREEASFALTPEFAEGIIPDPRLDRLVTATLSLDLSRRVEWLAKFPEPRRSRIVAASGNPWVVSEYAARCDAGALSRAILDAFLDDGCEWITFQAHDLLLMVEPLAALREALSRTSGKKRSVLERAIRERTGEGFYKLALRDEPGGVAAELRRSSGELVASATLSRALLPDQFAFVREAIGDPSQAVVLLETELDETRAYQAFLRLGEAVRCEIRHGGTTQTRSG